MDFDDPLAPIDVNYTQRYAQPTLYRVVERAPVKELFANPRHAYTQGLLSSIPRLNGTPKSELQTIDGMVPALSELKPGCRFASRSGREHAPELLVERQSLKEIAPGHWVEACPVCTRG